MRRRLIFTVLAAGMLLVMLKIAESASPAMRERCSEMRQRMLANMPESFPPKRMMARVEGRQTPDRSHP